jgi:hypothetical protein
MAAFTMNISNRIQVLGNGPSTRWGEATFPATMIWGAAKWGEGRPMQFRFVKYVTNAPLLAWDRTGGSMTKIWNQTMVISSDMGSEFLRNGIWNYVFTSDASDGEDRSVATWAEGTGSVASYTCFTASGTSWSEA